MARRRLHHRGRKDALPEPAVGGDLHDAGSRARGRARDSDEAARVLRLPHRRHPRPLRGRRAVEIDADVGGDALRGIASKDDGASRLGELALVDGEGRIGPLGTVFHETLLDENAASHIALGNAYTFPLEDEADRAKATCRRSTPTS